MTRDETPEPLLLRAPEVAKLLGVSRAKAYRLIKAGELPTVRIGGSVRVPREALREWISANTEVA